MGEVIRFDRSFSFADLEGERCPPALRRYAAIWVAWKRGEVTGKLETQLNNRAGRLTVAAQMESGNDRAI